MKKSIINSSIILTVFTLLLSSCSNLIHHHNYNIHFSNDNNYHWREASCGHDVVSDFALHEYDTEVNIEYVEEENDEMRTVTGRLYCQTCHDSIDTAKLTDIYDDRLTFRKIDTIEDNNPFHAQYEPRKEAYSVSSHVRKEDISYQGEGHDVYTVVNNDYGDFVIPDTYNGLPVNLILSYAFKDKHFSSLTIGKNIEGISNESFAGASFDSEVVIPDNVKYMDYNAFFCSDLKKITLSNSITEIRPGTFLGCRQLESVVLNNNIRSIQKLSFSSCINLKTITLPIALEELDGSAFSDCTSLKEIVVPKENKHFIHDGKAILSKNKRELVMPLFLDNREYTVPNSVQRINELAFRFIYSEVLKINLNKNLKYIGDLALSSCWDVEELKIPKKVEYIGERAFSNCVALKSLTLPKSIKYLGADLLNDCLNLRRLTYEGTVSNWKKIEKDPRLFDGSKISFIDCVDGTIHISEALNVDE